MTAHRVAITGIGLVTALGATREESWTRLLDGGCGIGPVTVFETEGYRSRVAAEAPAARIASQFTPAHQRRLSRGDQFGVAAADEALGDSGLLDSGVDRARVGVILGAGTADLLRNEVFHHTVLTRGIRFAKPSDAWNHFSSTALDVIASRFGFEGPRSCVVAACASSTIAIGQAADAIRAGRIDAALAGGADALARLTFSGFNALRLMDPGPCRPFDRSRAGMNIGEGAAIAVLEDMACARRRGARIYAEVAGFACGCEAYHPTAPEPLGRPLAAVVEGALRDAGVPPDAVDHVNTHGTATPQNDRAEANGLRAAFGDRLARLPVTANKSSVGHCLGAAGGIEAAILALTISNGVIPPTVHHAEADPDCALDVVAGSAREVPVRLGVSTSLGFGGNDAALVLRRV